MFVSEQSYEYNRNTYDKSFYIKASISAGVNLFDFIEVSVSGDFLYDTQNMVSCYKNNFTFILHCSTFQMINFLG